MPLNRPTAVRLSLLVAALQLAAVPASAQAPAGAGAPSSITEALRRAVPSVHWDASGLLVYSLRAGDSTSLRALEPRTGIDQPYAVPATPVPEEPRAVGPALFAHMAPVRELTTSDRRWFAGIRDGDVWLRPAGSDSSVRMTTVAEPEYGFDLVGAKWSPDDRLLAVKRMDGRGVPTIPLVRWSEPGQPVTRHPYSRVGEPIPRADLYVVDREGGEPVLVDAGTDEAPYLHIVGWGASGEELHFMRISRFTDRVDLLAADPRTGRSRKILSETSGTFILGLPFLHGFDIVVDEWMNHVELLEHGRFIWTSERDGWRRLYLHDRNGTLIRPLTPEGSEVQRLEAVDEERGWVYYTARVDPERPYDTSLLRVRLDGGEPNRLVGGPTFDVVEFAPSQEFFWTMRGSPDRPPVVEVRRSDGALVRQVWSGDAIARREGRSPPEQVTATASDGQTELFGLLFKPRDFDPDRTYPVVDFLYLGPQTTHVPRSMLSQTYHASERLADLGFLVLTVDARGTPGRGKRFHDAFYGEIGQHEIADHAAVIRQIAAERPYMDLERVGAFGHSWGGYGALRAVLQAPDLYRVGVAGAPGVDLNRFRVSMEPYMGCPPAQCPDAYEGGSSTALAGRLEGKLLLLTGTSDDDVPFGEVVDLIDALIRAGKPYDLVIFPEGHHLIQGPYWWGRVTGYLREHLQP